MPSLGTRQMRGILDAHGAEWVAGPTTLNISANEVHVWKVDLFPRAVPDVNGVLSSDERERASRFHFERDRQRFMIAHSSLRMILGRYLNFPPAMLTFGQTDYGKPFLTNIEAAGLLFNMSHSGDVAVIAVAREREVGIDVELMRADFATSEVAEHFVSVVEFFAL